MGNRVMRTKVKYDQNDLIHIAKQTGFSLEEVELWYRSFINDCPNGKLSRKRFCKVYKQFYSYGKPLKFSNLIFNAFDEDKDNKINFYEFTIALNVILHGNLEEKLKCAFKIYDSNNDGVIDKKEMKTVIDSIYELIGEDMKHLKKTRLSERKVNDIFEKLDTDKDNFITLKEFMDGYVNDEYFIKLLNTTVSFKNNDNNIKRNSLTTTDSCSELTVDSQISTTTSSSSYDDCESEYEYITPL